MCFIPFKWIAFSIIWRVYKEKKAVVESYQPLVDSFYAWHPHIGMFQLAEQRHLMLKTAKRQHGGGLFSE